VAKGIHSVREITRGLSVEDRCSRLVDIYLTAEDAVIAHGFDWEIDWQAERRFERIQETDFLRESAWTVLSAGFRESVIRKLFGPLSEAFLDWRSAGHIHERRRECKVAALKVFGNERKISAILDIAAIVAKCGFGTIRSRIDEDGVSFLQTLPYIGPVTAFHLAKNLGLPVVKPDRHLQRMARAAGFRSPLELCQEIANRTGDPIQVIDIVLWRYATLFSNYLAVFTPLSSLCHPEASLR
jgi:hypothetical protein